MKAIFSIALLVGALLASISKAEYISGGGGVNCAGGTTGQVLTTNGTTCSFTTVSGTGTVTTVNTDSTSSGVFANTANVIGTTVVTLTYKTQAENKVWIGPSSGSDAAPTFRLLVGADLPLPGASSLGGVFSKAAVSHQFLTAIVAADGSVTSAQPAFSDISGSATSGQMPSYLNANSLGNSLVMVTDSSGNINTAASTTVTEVGYVHGVTSPIQTQLNNVKVEQLDGQITSPGNATFVIRAYAEYAGTINSIYIGTASGTDTVAININGTPVTSLSAISVSSSGATSTATGANTFSAGDQITLVTSSDSSAAGLYWSMNVTRN